jgi:hypothetical protein
MVGLEPNKHTPTEKELAAYNEAGHAIVGRLQGQYIGPILLYRGENEHWGGSTEYDIFICPFVLDLFSNELYARFGLSIPQGGAGFSIEEKCTMKFAGVVAEKRLCEHCGVNSDEVRIGEADILEAEELVSRLPQDQAQKVLHDAEALAWTILKDNTCWKAVEVLAQELIQRGRLDQEYIHTLVSHILVS